MTLDEFRQSLTATEPPPGLPLALAGLWWDAKGDWTRAHESAQQDEGIDGSWVHAYLHRKEGDQGNAAYWYSRTGKPVCSEPLDAEWLNSLASFLIRIRTDPINRVDARRGLTFGDLAQHYAEHELVECSESIRPKAHTTIRGYERVLRNRLLPRWGNRIALGIEPLEVEPWLRALKKEGDLANPTLDKTRRVMSLVYKHGQRYGLLPRTQESNPMRFVRCKTTSGYEAAIVTPAQAFAIVCNLREPERTLTLLAAGTGLRISECLGLQWHDVNFAEGM